MTEAEVTPFESLLEANNRAKALVKGGFTLGAQMHLRAPSSSQPPLITFGT